MAWNIELSDRAKKGLKKVGPVAAGWILDCIYNKLAVNPTPEHAGEELKGPIFGGMRRIKVREQYRVIFRIEKDQLLIVVVRAAHRKDAYRI